MVSRFLGAYKINDLTSVFAALPTGSTFISVEHFGTSAWTITGRVIASSPDGTETSYFLKVGLQKSLTIEWIIHDLVCLPVPL